MRYIWLCLLLNVAVSRAATNQWTGAGGNNLWTNSANWSLGTLPNSTHNVVIPSTTNEVLLNDTAQVASLRLGGASNATLNISGGSLTCTSNSLVHSNGTILLAGNLVLQTSSDGVSFAVDGTINWTGGLLGAGGLLGMRINSSGTLSITGAVTKTLGGRLFNNGVISCYATNLQGDSYLCIYNTNVFILHSNLSLTASSPLGPILWNFGTILTPADSGVRRLDTAWGVENFGTIKVETNSVLEVRPQWFDAVWFEDGTVLDGSGVIRLPTPNYNPGVRCTGLITLNTTLDSSAGLIAFDHSTWTGPGLLKLQAGMTDFTFGPGFHVEVTTSGTINLNGMCTNQGVVRWLGNGQLGAGNGCTFYNEGQFLLETNCSLFSDNGVYGNFINTGTILNPVSNSVSSFTVKDWNFTNRGTIKAETNAVLEVRPDYGSFDGLVFFENGTVFDGPGIVRFPYTFGTGRFTWNGNMTLNGTLEYQGLGIHGASVWSGPGLFRWIGGGMNEFTFGPGFRVEIYSVGMSGNCTNQGIVRLLGSSSLYLYRDTAFNNYGQLTVETNASLLTYEDPPPTFNNFGTVELKNGTLSVMMPYTASPSSTLKEPIGGTAQGTGFGHVSFDDNSPFFSGVAPFAGNFSVVLTNGFVPAAGNSFTIADYLSYTGTFSTNSFPALPNGLQWQLNYGPSALTLSVVASPVVSNAMQLPDGNFAFQVAGPAGGSAVIQATTNLDSPTVWTNTATNTPFTGVYNFTDTQATNFPWRFYRALMVP